MLKDKLCDETTANIRLFPIILTYFVTNDMVLLYKNGITLLI